jgi:hypothetical protein
MPDWFPYMLAACAAATLIGYIAAWLLDEWRNR